MDFNTEQQLAIEKRGNGIGNILVSAGAGSGKTAVLAERVLSMVSEPDNHIDIDKLLILTFTKNAASEMRQRISDKLKKLKDKLFFEAPTSKEYINIKKQLSILNRANITTIDSFCNTVVRRYFYKIDIDPGYRIAGSDNCTELTKLSNEAIDELFELNFAENNKDFIELVEYFCPKGYDNNNLKNILKKINEVLSSVPSPQKWLDDTLSVYALQDDEAISPKMSTYIAEYFATIHSKALNIINEAEEIIKTVYNDAPSARFIEAKQEQKAKSEAKGKPKSDYKFVIYQNNFAKARRIIDSFADSFDYSEVYNAFNINFDRLTGGKIAADTPEILVENMPKLGKLWSDFKENIYDKLSTSIVNTPPDNLRSIILKQYKIVSSLFTLYREYEKSYTAKKNELSLVSFSDINHYCIKILLNDDGTPTAEASELRSSFDEVIVDEYQDINTMQECILSTLTAHNNNMFMVGDIKQSIYKFRHACPEIFAQKYNTYDHTNLSEGNICISLNRNYRSRKSVLDFINIIFYQTMRKDFGGIDYTEADALKAGADFPNSELNICTDNELIICKKDSAEPVTSSEDIDELTEVEELADNEAEAHIIAQRISELINENNPTYVYDRKLNEYRPCRLSDITILMRSPNKAAYSYSNVLSSYGIPSVSGSKYTLFNELEIRTVMAILKVIDNPYQDRDLITVLHCPIYNVSCSELAKLKLINRNAFMYENVLCYIEQADENDTLKNKLTEFTALLKNVHQLILSKPFCEVLNYIFVATDYLNYLNLINNSSLRITNLKLLTAMAEQMFNSGITDFGSIVSGLCDIEKENPDFESTTLSDYENAVQILSIHKSKGLEFPIVFVAQFDKDLTRMFHADETFIDTDYGIALKCFDTQSRVKADFLYRTATLFLAKRSELTEELRLLYVALTRAKEKLIMVASAKKYDERMDKWSSCSDINRQNMYLPLSAVSESSSYLDWVMLAYFGCNALKDTIDIDSIFKIRTTNVADISTDNFGTEHLKDLYAKFTKDSAPEKETDELDRKLINDYLDMTAVTLPSKISISEIKRQHRVDEYKQLEYDLTALDAADSERILQVLNQNKERDTQVTFEPPTFIQESKDILYGAAKGTAYHTVFEHLRLDYSSTKESIEAQIHSLFERNILSKAELNCVQAEKFVKYLQSELGKRICKSQGVYRETPFVMQLSPNEIYDKEGYNDTFARILVHGIIDLYFEEDDELVLVDYKTDVVNSKNSPQNIRDRYKIQLEFYKKALERNTNKKVKEMYLYLVSIDEAIKYE